MPLGVDNSREILNYQHIIHFNVDLEITSDEAVKGVALHGKHIRRVPSVVHSHSFLHTYTSSFVFLPNEHDEREFFIPFL